MDNISTQLLMASSYSPDAELPLDPDSQGRVLSGFTYTTIAHSPTLNMFIAVSSGGIIGRSTDGLIWASVPNIAAAALGNVRWVNDRFVIGTTNGRFLYSLNGINWSIHTIDGSLTQTINDMAWDGNSVYVAIGAGGAIRTATSMLGTWASRVSGVTTSLNEIVYHPTFGFVIVGAANYIRTSIDGVSWAARTSPLASTAVFNSVETSGFHIVAVTNSISGAGRIVRSTDGVNWSEVTSQLGSQNLTRVRYSAGMAGQFVVTGNSGGLQISGNGLTWTAISTGTYTGSCTCYVGANGVNIITGVRRLHRFLGNSITSPIVSSSDISAFPNGASVLSIANGNGLFVAVGDSGTIATSPDRITWTVRQHPMPSATQLASVCWTGSGFVAVGANGRIIHSTDGITWTNRTSPTAITLTSVASNGNIVCAVGNGVCVSSLDGGLTWTQRTPIGSTVTNMAVIRFLGGQFISVGASGRIIKTTDGVSWTAQTVSSGRSWSDIAWSGVRYIITGDAENLLRSTDGGVGNTWQPFTLDDSSFNPGFSAVIWTGTQFVAVGALSAMWTSPDGLSWTRRSFGALNNLFAVHWDGTRILVAYQFGPFNVSNDGISWSVRNIGSDGYIGVFAIDSLGRTIMAGAGGGMIIPKWS